MFKVGSFVNVFVSNTFLTRATIVTFDYDRELVEVENLNGKRFMVHFDEVEAG